MKRLTAFSLLIIFATTALLTLGSCGKDNLNGEVDLKIAFKVGNEDFKTGEIYTINGTAVQFDVAKFYIGGIAFSADGTTSAFEDTYLLVSPDQSKYSVGQLDKDIYNKLEFFIGIDDATNSQSEEDFTTRSSSDPLAVQDPAMHWNWNTGYKFLRFDGTSDLDGNGTPEAPIAYHIGNIPNNNLRTTLSFSLPEKISGNSIDIAVDVAQLFDGIDFTTQLDTHTANDLPLAKKITDNYVKAFSVTE